MPESVTVRLNGELATPCTVFGKFRAPALKVACGVGANAVALTLSVAGAALLVTVTVAEKVPACRGAKSKSSVQDASDARIAGHSFDSVK